MKRWIALSVIVLWVGTAMGQWQQTNYTEPMSVEDIFFVNEDVGYVVGYHEMYKTTDGGDSWSLVVANLFPNGPRHVFFINENVGFMAGSNSGLTTPIEIAKTINGGISWTVTELEGNPMTFSYGTDLFFVDENTGFLVCNGGSVYRTTDQGDNWIRVYNDANEDFSEVHFPTPAVGYMIPTWGDEIYKTINGGNSWAVFPTSVSMGNFGLHFVDEMTGFIVGNYSRIQRTTDGGMSWELTDLGTSDSFSDIQFTSATTGYAVGTNGTLVTTNDGGNTWTPRLSGVGDHLVCIDMVTDSVGYIGTSGFAKVLKTTNGGGILSINETLEDAPISIFPNPTNGIAQVSYPELKKPCGYRIVNTQGQVVQTGMLLRPQSSIDLIALPAGMYLLQLDALSNYSARFMRVD